MATALKAYGIGKVATLLLKAFEPDIVPVLVAVETALLS
jgi:hypothetical protein